MKKRDDNSKTPSVPAASPLVFPALGPPRASRGGAPRKPTEQRMLEGNRGHRPPDPLEPKPPAVTSISDIPTPPSHLDELAARIWATEFGPLLVKMKVMTQADWTALGMLCQLESRRRVLEDDIAESGMFYWATTTSGDKVEKIRPQVGEVGRVGASVAVMMREFGLTPASRGKVQMVPGAGTKGTGGEGEGENSDKSEEGYFG